VPKTRKQQSMTGALILAVIAGVVIGVVLYNPLDTPPPGPAKVEIVGEYDDSWGRLKTKVAKATVTHILVSWTGANPRSQPKEPRSKDEARKLIDQLWLQFRNNPTEGNWRKMQAQFNEDSQPHTPYEVDRNASLVQPFKDCSMSTEINHARVVESEFGFHLIRREK
jgi:hypothetical protein